jgi:hypothetical protein
LRDSRQMREQLKSSRKRVNEEQLQRKELGSSRRIEGIVSTRFAWVGQNRMSSIQLNREKTKAVVNL